jgi:hypothetical protein
VITTAQQAFTFLAGSVASGTNQHAKTYATVFRGLAELCGQIPCELPGPDVVAYALLRISEPVGGDAHAGQRETWRDLGQKLIMRTLGLDDPELGVEFTSTQRLPEAIWLWQMLGFVAKSRLEAIPEVMGNQQTGQLFIMRNSLQVAISQGELMEFQHETSMMGMLAEGLRRELKTLIEHLCPERTATIKAHAFEAMAREKAAREVEQDPGQDEVTTRPMLAIVKD